MMVSDDDDQTSYRVFIIDDPMICENCKQHGHIKSHCKTDTTNTESTLTLNYPVKNQPNYKIHKIHTQIHN